MKKLLSLFLAIVCLLVFALSLFSCKKELESFNGMDIKAVYKAAQDAFLQENNYTFRHEVEIEEKSFLFFHPDFAVTWDVKMDGRDYEERYTYHEDPLENHSVAYVDEIHYYSSMRYGKTRSNILHGDEKKYDIDLQVGLFDLPDDWLDSAGFYKDGDGVCIEIIVDAQEYYEYVKRIGEAGDLWGEPVDEVICYVYLNADGKVYRFKTEMYSFHIKSGMEVKRKAVDTWTYSEFGTTVVSPPSDADSYDWGIHN